MILIFIACCLGALVAWKIVYNLVKLIVLLIALPFAVVADLTRNGR